MQDPPPKYPDEARKQGIQGSVAFEVTIDERGFPADITALRPLGFGLDEAARAAIEKWRWTPATKDGVPVKVTNTIVVNFRLDRANGFDERTEQNRTAFNRAVNELSASKEARERGVRKIFDLAHQQYPPAMSTVGVWEVNGENVDKNPTDGLALIQKAAAKNYGPALYEIAMRQINGTDLPLDVEKGIETMKRAAMPGSVQAQFNLGQRYENGKGVPVDIEHARRNFRLCAAHGVGVCQYRLGVSLLEGQNRTERNYVQGLAWLEVAADDGMNPAQAIVDRELPNLTGPQLTAVKSLRATLAKK